MGEVERGVGPIGAQPQHPPRLQQFLVGEPAILPPEHQGPAASLLQQGRLQPSQGFGRTTQRQPLRFHAAAGGHHPGAVRHGAGQIGKQLGPLEQGLGVHRHQPGFFPPVIAARGHQPQIVDVEVGAEPGHAPHVEGTGRLHQHHRHAHVSVCR